MTGTGSLRSRRTPPEVNSLFLSYVTAAGPRCEDRIRISKDTGLNNLPLHGFNQNQIWCAIVAIAVELTAWMQMLALTRHDARRWEPKRLRLRLFSIPATLVRTARQIRLHVAEQNPWAVLVVTAISRLDQLAAPG